MTLMSRWDHHFIDNEIEQPEEVVTEPNRKQVVTGSGSRCRALERNENLFM